MAITARFIGVGKYIDSHARELPGARRDATALWALFSDSLPDADAKLLIDEAATAEAIRAALSETLTAATSDDDVIFYFAGHGTPDHRLVAHNTVSEAYGETTISMDELSDLFKTSKAKSVLCILDCCFSGGITARVFENAPTPRAVGISLENFAGQGQVFIAASDFDEYSYEIPTTGHGIFTKALLDTLEELEKPTDVQEIMSKVMEAVRAEASTLGLVQTPVMYGKITGGLQLPQFKRGANFAKHFPERTGIKVSGAVADLATCGIPREVISAWTSRLTNGLNSLQIRAINDFGILDGESLMVVAPTSSGKTFVGEIAAAKAIADDKKVVFLFPYRALTNEKFEYFSELYAERLGMRVVRCTGDYSDQATLFINGKYDIALLTYEMFLGLAVNNPAILSSIGLVVLDEAQFITDPTRGITVELLLTQLNSLKETAVKPQLITLSAAVGEINHFNEWLGIQVLQTDERPVPLTECVLDREGMLQCRKPDGEIETLQLLPSHAIQTRRDKPGSQDVIVPLVRKLITDSASEKIIIFRSSRGSAAGCANYLADELGLPPATGEIVELPAFDLSDTSERLRACMNHGTAFHTTDLAREERSTVEKAFRADNDHIRVLAATTTVAAGVNTPASTVILVEHEFPGSTKTPYTVAEYKNMVGRAGRLGFQEEGRSILLAETARERETLFNKYVCGTPEAINSSFSDQDITTWLLRLMAQVRQINRADAVRLLTNTYGGYLLNRNNPAWRDAASRQVEACISDMVMHGFLEEQEGNMRLTQLGMVCGQSSLKFSSIVRIIELIQRNENRIGSMEELLLITQALPEADERYTPMARTETQWPGIAERAYGSRMYNLLNYQTPDTLAFSKRCKRASILHEWVTGTPIDQIRSEHTTNVFASVAAGDIRSLADAARFNLRSVHQIASIVLQGKCPDEKQLEEFARRLEVGIPADSIELLLLPISLERGDYLHLSTDSEIKSVAQYWAKTPSELKAILGSKAEALERHRPTT